MFNKMLGFDYKDGLKSDRTNDTVYNFSRRFKNAIESVKTSINYILNIFLLVVLSFE